MSGDIGYKSVIAAISGDLSMVSSMNLNMTSNGNIAKSSLEMMCIKIAYEYMKSAILLTVERDGCCHLLSLSSKGRLGYMQNYPSLVPSNKKYSSSNFKAVLSVMSTGKRGLFLVGGHSWMKTIYIKLD